MFEYFQKMIVRKYEHSTRRQTFFENARRYQFFLGVGVQTNSKNGVFSGSIFEKFSKFQKVERWENNIF